MSRSLSDLEAKLILHLEWEKQPVVTIDDTMTILDCSYDHARLVLHRLARRRWLVPLTPGKYELIPPERGGVEGVGDGVAGDRPTRKTPPQYPTFGLPCVPTQYPPRI